MDNIIHVRELIEELEQFPDDCPIMIAVIKYPGEFAIRTTQEGELRWDLGTDVEVNPLEEGEISLHEGQVWLQVELEEYDTERALLNGAKPEV
jgi:hypothetical protein